MTNDSPERRVDDSFRDGTAGDLGRGLECARRDRSGEDFGGF